MDLWIRSQDKMKFRRVIDLGIFEEQEGYTIYCDDSIDNILGTYATQGRALKVLDEIQETQLGNYHYRCPSNVKVSNNENTIVYEMPKE